MCGAFRHMHAHCEAFSSFSKILGGKEKKKKKRKKRFKNRMKTVIGDGVSRRRGGRAE